MNFYSSNLSFRAKAPVSAETGVFCISMPIFPQKSMFRPPDHRFYPLPRGRSPIRTFFHRACYGPRRIWAE